ncbi:MAG TPA: M14 family zinc carboxypeptidase [Nocardioidaceae bacterium]|nr:M14 family zinc carboxypeptidase [Nocardioidaceae bacterium]
MRRLLVAVLAGVPLVAGPVLPLLALPPASAGPHAGPDSSGGHILEWKRIGESVRGRAIWAFRVGDPDARVKAVVLGAIHGDEPAGIVLARALKEARRIEGVDLWVVPTINPDGVARGTRGNARGVDLNRNWGRHWAPLTGRYYSGPAPFSEPETRAFRDFLRRVKPRFVVSFHQPLYGVGRAYERVAFQRRLAQELRLPRRWFTCNGGCHGTMTQWFNHWQDGTAITVEFGRRPSRDYLAGRAMRGTVRSVLGRF